MMEQKIYLHGQTNKVVHRNSCPVKISTWHLKCFQAADNVVDKDEVGLLPGHSFAHDPARFHWVGSNVYQVNLMSTFLCISGL